MATPTTHWTAQAIPTEDARRLLALLFAPEAELAQEADHADPPMCGLNAAFDRIDRHLAWFDADARAQAETALSEVA